MPRSARVAAAAAIKAWQTARAAVAEHWRNIQSSASMRLCTSVISAPTIGRSSSAELRKNLNVGNESTRLSPTSVGVSSASIETNVTAAYLG